MPGGAPEGVVADSVSGVVAVALRNPSRLALIDTRTAQVTRVVPVPGAARHLQLVAPGGPVIVPGEDTDVVARVDLRTGEVQAQTKVGRQPHDAAAVDGRLYVADELGGTTTVV
ncbi:MAG: YncE family protein, partial [Actinomycetota bacterium]|nr:YncE family protein [Actinomycetota bacterium]